MSLLVSALCFFLPLSFVHPAQDFEQDEAEVDELLQAYHDLHEPGRHYVSLELPVPISRYDLERYRQILTLSEDQAVFVADRYEDYAEAYRRLIDERIRALIALSAEVKETPRRPSPVEWAEKFRKLMRAREDVVRSIESIDQDFFELLVPILAEPQMAKFARITYDRARRRHNVHESMTAIDLNDLIAKLGVTCDDSDALPRSWGPILAEYDQEAARVFRRVDTTWSAAMLKYADMWTEGSVEDREAREQALRHSTDAQVSARKMNLNYVYRLKAAACPVVAEALEQAFNETAYPDIYPDPDYAGGALRGVHSVAGLSTDQRDLLSQVEASYSTAYARVCNAMVEEYVSWRATFAASYGASGPDQRAHAETLDTLRQDRERLNADVWVQLKQILDVDQFATLKATHATHATKTGGNHVR